MVEVFKTNVVQKETASLLIAKLREWMPACKMTFDLEDCDRIFRIESASIAIDVDFITHFFKQNGFVCGALT